MIEYKIYFKELNGSPMESQLKGELHYKSEKDYNIPLVFRRPILTNEIMEFEKIK